MSILPENEKQFVQMGGAPSPDNFGFEILEKQFREFPSLLSLYSSILTICKDAVVGIEPEKRGWLIRIPRFVLLKQLVSSFSEWEVELAMIELRKLIANGIVTVDYQDNIYLGSGSLIKVFFHAYIEYDREEVLQSQLDAIAHDESVESIDSLDELG